MKYSSFFLPLILLINISFITQENFSFIAKFNRQTADSLCSYTISRSEGNGLSLKIYKPCSWIGTEGKTGTTKAFKQNDGGMSMSVSIFKAKENEMGYYITVDQVKKMYDGYATVKQIRETKIEGVKTIETILEMNDERPVGKIYLKGIFYTTVYKNWLFTIAYSIAGLNKEDVDKSFEGSLFDFKIMASKIEIVNKTT